MKALTEPLSHTPGGENRTPLLQGDVLILDGGTLPAWWRKIVSVVKSYDEGY